MKRCANIYIGTAGSFKQPQWFRSKPTEIYEIYGDGSKPTPSFEGHVHPQTIFMGQYYTIFPKRYSPIFPPPRRNLQVESAKKVGPSSQVPAAIAGHWIHPKLDCSID